MSQYVSIDMGRAAQFMNDLHSRTKKGSSNRCALMSASVEQKGNRAHVLKAVKEDGRSLIYASDELKHDKEIVMEALHRNFWVSLFVSATLTTEDPVHRFIFTYEDIADFFCQDISSQQKEENWQAIKKTLLEEPSLLTNRLLRELKERVFYDTAVALAKNRLNIESCPLPQLD